MKGQKRPIEDDDSDSSRGSAVSDNEPDISNALTSHIIKSRNSEDDLSDEELNAMIQDAISKRNVKGGAEVVKKAKGKERLVKGEVGGGSFQSMGLYPWLLRSLTLQGYRTPTPIQRLSIPALLTSPPRDLVGMARTGSGKSLAYLIPLVQRLGGQHTTVFGARALILLPTRELALQILKVGKELTRGRHAGGGKHAGDAKDPENKGSQGLRWGLVVGGDGMDEQFETITGNPDVIIATPGRLLHLIVEMNLDLKSVQYVVFDEADRLFEMGFETAMNEILLRLPKSRQTLLFSATLPKSLVEFAKAGLQEPKLVRLDAESKISSDLKMAFFYVKQAEKDACLLSLLRDVIKVPYGGTQPKLDEPSTEKTKKGKNKYHDQLTAPHQTLVFAATKHHVEYLLTLLTTAGYATSHIYGSLDQSARTHQMDQFRRGLTSILVVTDVAARGIDIPVLENVINYDFPHGARVFIHRVGRTARAGRQGWAWSFFTNTELPCLLDLQLFLGRPLTQVAGGGDHEYTEKLVIGTFSREKIDEDMEYVKVLDEENQSLPTLREVKKRGHAMYERSKGKASQASHSRAKEMLKTWSSSGLGVHPMFLRTHEGREEQTHQEKRKALLDSISSFRPTETVFEVGKKGDTGNSVLMKARRKALSKAEKRVGLATTSIVAVEEEDHKQDQDVQMANEDDIAAVFETSNKKDNYRDSQFYLSHYQKDSLTDKGYSLKDGASSFAEQARGATFDLTGDETLAKSKRRQLNWDKKKKNFVKGDGAGADNVKLVKTESGTKLPATYRSGRYDEWKAKTRLSLPKVGEIEESVRLRQSAGRKFRHNRAVPAKPLDKLRNDYDRKVRQMKKRENGEDDGAGRSSKAKNVGKRSNGKPIGKVKTELKTVEQIRKNRKLKERRKAKNARPSRRKGRR